MTPSQAAWMPTKEGSAPRMETMPQDDFWELGPELVGCGVNAPASRWPEPPRPQKNPCRFNTPRLASHHRAMSGILYLQKAWCFSPGEPMARTSEP